MLRNHKWGALEETVQSICAGVNLREMCTADYDEELIASQPFLNAV
jgi:hypothetical protein